MDSLPYEVELLIYNYNHQLHSIELKKEINKNIKTSRYYNLKWKGIINNYYNYNENSNHNDLDKLYDSEYSNIIKDKYISSSYYRNILFKNLDNVIKEIEEDLDSYV